MSAYMCEDQHLVALSALAASLRYSKVSSTEAYKILHAANVHSLQTRYSKDLRQIPPLEDSKVLNEALRVPVAQISVAAWIKSIRCYQYQACEFEGWHKSVAYELTEAMLSEVVTRLPEYETAAWGAPKY